MKKQLNKGRKQGLSGVETEEQELKKNKQSKNNGGNDWWKWLLGFGLVGGAGYVGYRVWVKQNTVTQILAKHDSLFDIFLNKKGVKTQEVIENVKAKMAKNKAILENLVPLLSFTDLQLFNQFFDFFIEKLKIDVPNVPNFELLPEYKEAQNLNKKAEEVLLKFSAKGKQLVEKSGLELQ